MAKDSNDVLKYIAVYFFTWLSGLIALLLAGKDDLLPHVNVRVSTAFN